VTTHVIVDTGPLVAFLNRRDEWHTWAVAQFSQVAPPLLTCEGVLSEAAFLLRRDHAGVDGLLQLVDRRLVTTPFRADDEIDDVRRLMKRYANVPMSFADACLVRMAEHSARASVMTLDADFRTYRRLGRQVIPLIAPTLSPRLK
jgi:predicted nucleic acid-binding protein